MKEENMDEFNFKSSPHTSIEQSEKLLTLGLKKETADMCLQSTLNDVWSPYIPIAMPYSKIEAFDLSTDVFRVIPAWSLHRLIELAYGNWDSEIVPIYLGNSYDMLIERIEFQVKRGKFNKKYLCES